jgi:hypothetical protein
LERRSHRGDSFAAGVAEGLDEQRRTLFDGRIETHCFGSGIGYMAACYNYFYEAFLKYKVRKPDGVLPFLKPYQGMYGKTHALPDG